MCMHSRSARSSRPRGNPVRRLTAHGLRPDQRCLQCAPRESLEQTRQPRLETAAADRELYLFEKETSGDMESTTSTNLPYPSL